MSITSFDEIDFGTPFLDSSEEALSPALAYPMPVELGGHGYVMDLKKYQRRTLSQFRQASDISREPGEQSLAVEGVWKRTQKTWHIGAGQLHADDNDSLRERFYSSKGIDVWNKRSVCLLPATDQKRTSTATNLQLLSVGGVLVVSDGSQAYYTSDATVDAPTWTSEDLFSGGSTSTILKMASNGTLIYAAIQSGTMRVFTPGAGGSGVPATAVTHAAENVWYANGWLITSIGAALYRVAVSTPGSYVATVHKTHENTGFVWVSVVGSPVGIYAGGTGGDVSEIYRIGITELGALDVPIVAGTLPTGETLYTMAYYQKTMLLGTSAGFRLAVVEDSGGLSIGPLISMTLPVRALEPRGQYVWFGWSNYDAVSSGLGRLDLALFSSDLVPAYSSDLMATGQGECLSVCTHQGKRFFSLSGLGVWGQDTALVSSGELVSGWFGMESPERKILASAGLAHDSLPLDATVTLFIEDDVFASFQLGVSATVGTRGAGSDFVGQSIDSELHRYRIVLTRGSVTTTGPCVKRITLRVIPAPLGVEEIVAPLLIADVVRVDDARREVRYDPYDEYYFLKALEQSRQIVTWREGQVSHSVTVRDVAIEGVDGWAKRRRFFNATIIVRMVTLEGVPSQIGNN